MDKLIKQFKRDFKKNPKKVVLLGVLFVVCLWVVVPLFLPKEEPKPVPRPSTAVATVPTAAGQTVAVAAPTARWQDLDRALNNDPRMRSAGDEADVAAFPPPRNPFETPFDVDAAMDEFLEDIAAETEAEQAVAAETTTEPVPLQAQFDAVPLELSSTIIGGEQAIAVINGRTFHSGEKIGTAYGKEVTLKSVAPRSVEVDWNGVTRTLRILSPREAAPQATLAGTRTTP